MPSNRQSIAGSLFQTLSRLCSAVGFGVATAIFNAVSRKPASSGYYANNAFEPFAACFWFSAGMAAVGLCFVPWLRIGTQGGSEDASKKRGASAERDEDLVEEAAVEEEKEKSLMGTSEGLETKKD